MKLQLACSTITAACFWFALSAAFAHDAPFTLKTVRADIARSHPAVKQLCTSDLASLLARPGNTLLLDVREPQEYAVSHLPGAIRIPPLNTFGQTSFLPTESDVKGKTVVLYCSVGMRSSDMAQKLQDDLRRRGALNIYNLDGGIFAWHNESRVLVNNAGPTSFVHPYNAKYKQLLQHSDLVRFGP